jgi:NAD(P)-dependent dehydrogenase (short-subunit alcohol dehydrogenase family)
MKTGAKAGKWQESPAHAFLLPDLAGRTAVVTGSSSGIGRATVQGLLANGTRVFGLDRNASDLRHERFTPVRCDLSDTAAIRKAFSVVSGRVSALDYVVNVAGIDPKYAISKLSVQQWDRMVDLNLRAYCFVIQQALPGLRRGSGRAIVNVSSINYRLGVAGRSAYAATKAGILGLTTGLSRELGSENIRINTVSPGWIFTERQVADYFSGGAARKHLAHLARQQSIQLKITPEDVANHILFYLSEVSRASTGHNCVVDAGWLLE